MRSLPGLQGQPSVKDFSLRQCKMSEQKQSYNMPAYRGKRIFFYFLAFKKHIGIYPPVTADKQLIAELAPYRGPKGNLSFPLSSPLPIELIGRVAMALYREHEQTD